MDSDNQINFLKIILGVTGDSIAKIVKKYKPSGSPKAEILTVTNLD